MINEKMIKAFFEPEDITQSSPVSSLDDELRRPGEKSFSKRFILISGSLAHKQRIKGYLEANKK